MKRQHLIQLLQYLVAWVGIGLFVVFVMGESFIDFVLKYWVLFLVASISYFYYYSIEYETDKKYNLIRSVLLYGNLYIFAHVFFRPLLGISHELFVLLGLVILGLWGTTKMVSKRKWILQVLGGIVCFCILISGIFYLYPEEPDVAGFMNIRDYEILVRGISNKVQKMDAYIRIIGNKKTEEFDITPDFNKKLLESCRISYPSLKKDRDEKILITTPQGDVYQLYPQSELQIDFLGKDIVKIVVINGKIGFSSGMFNSSIEIIGDKYVLSGDELGGLESLNDGYKEELISYLKNQISDNGISLVNSKIVNKIDGKIIKYLSLIFPTTYSKNMHNYNEFQKYFSLVDDEGVELGKHSNGVSSSVSTTSLWKYLKKNAKMGKGSWYLF